MVVTVDLETHDDDWDMTDAATDTDESLVRRRFLLPPDELHEWQQNAKPTARWNAYTAFDTMQWCVF